MPLVTDARFERHDEPGVSPPPAGFAKLQYGIASIAGRKDEDRTSVVLSPQLACFGVFDGHGGQAASRYASEVLHTRVLREAGAAAFDGCGCGAAAAAAPVSAALPVRLADQVLVASRRFPTPPPQPSSSASSAAGSRPCQVAWGSESASPGSPRHVRPGVSVAPRPTTPTAADGDSGAAAAAPPLSLSEDALTRAFEGVNDDLWAQRTHCAGSTAVRGPPPRDARSSLFPSPKTCPLSPLGAGGDPPLPPWSRR